jgi:hypothetical protein
MSHEKPKDIEAQLTLRDRLNYPYYLGDAILTCNKSVLGQEYSKDQIIQASKNLRAMIPSGWEDDQFKEDIEKAKVIERIDIRPMVAGNMRLSEAKCKELGVSMYREEETFDYEKLRQTCINLLDRLHLLSRREFTEKMTGRKFKGEGEDIADTEVEEL